MSLTIRKNKTKKNCVRNISVPKLQQIEFFKIVAQSRNFQRPVSYIFPKSVRTSTYITVERVFLFWFNQMRQSGAVKSRNMIFEKAKIFSLKFEENFNPSGGWLYCYSQKNSMRMRISRCRCRKYFTLIQFYQI